MLSRRDGEAAAAIFLLGRSSFEFRTADRALFESAVVVLSPIALTDEPLMKRQIDPIEQRLGVEFGRLLSLADRFDDSGCCKGQEQLGHLQVDCRFYVEIEASFAVA